ncbi:MAG: hypothetical protein ACXWX6_06165 [Actinomycetota bacterium]
MASAPCRAGERVLVHERVMDDCVARLSAATRERIALGDPFDDEGTNYWESHLPFGGRAGSSSGVGRVGGLSMERLTELKTIVIDLG